MIDERYQRIAEYFAQLYELKPEQRAEALSRIEDDRIRAEVEELLSRHADPAPFLEQPPAASPIAPAAADPQVPQPAKFGRYGIIRVIASGGMGIVYEARQDHPNRTVALKVLRRGLASPGAIRRFQVEAEVLGRLDHPGIARVFDAGTHRDQSVAGWGENVPYFAMELVEGESLTEHAARRALSTPQRLDLVARVADAVHHAHQRGIIHRDLKPANILVTPAGDPKVVDFGVARASEADLRLTSAMTETGLLVGTVPYMSPEQLDGHPHDADTRSDVYSLGVVLYELLCGRPPHDLEGVSLPRALQLVREASARPIEAVDPSLRGDIATIVAKATAGDPVRRYASAAELAADLRRCIRHEPIAARPATVWYQARKFARRNRTLVIAIGAVVGVLAGASVVSTYMAVEASRQRTRAQAAQTHAEDALDDSLKVSGFLLEVFLSTPDKDVFTRTELLERAEGLINSRTFEDPRLEAKLREFVGHGWMKLGYPDRAGSHLERALALRESTGLDDDDAVKSLHLLAMHCLSSGQAERGRGLLRRCLELRSRLHGVDHLVTLPDEELRFFAQLHKLDTPDLARDAELRAAFSRRGPAPPEIAPPPMAGRTVLEDDFAGDSLDPAWRVELSGVDRWDALFGESRLRVTGIHLPAQPSAETPGVGGGVRLRRSIRIDRDFSVQARIGWDSQGSADVVQAVFISVGGDARRLIAQAMFSDSWVQWEGSQNALIGASGEVGRLQTRAISGFNTLPPKGSAFVEIRREGDRVVVFWDGWELLRGVSSEPVVEIMVGFNTTVYSGPEGSSRFGQLWIDHVRAIDGDGP